AVGDGQTDDRAAIQAAIDTAATGAGGGVVQFPAGTYLVEEIVVLKSNITLALDQNATILNGINQASHPSIIFMTGPFTDDGEQVLWGSTQNITIILLSLLKLRHRGYYLLHIDTRHLLRRYSANAEHRNCQKG
ncbi:MAG: hypothetical protein IIV16_02870, partial [Alistipes sp.]|nr:hypothetical protein [Alistipes sp.]